MNPASVSDQELIEGFKETGRVSVLDELFSRYLAMVRSAVYPMVLNDADADDLTQEVFVRAARGLAGFQGKASFSTWLYRIAMNATHRFLRQRAQQARSTDDSETDCPTPEWHHPDQTAMAGELGDAIAVALEALSPPLRAAIVLTVLQEVPIREASRIEGCTTATMYWRVHRARQQLRKELRRHVS